MGTNRTYRKSGNRTGPARRRHLLSADTAPVQFLRFLVAGGVANLAYAAGFLALSGLGPQPANVVAAMVSAAVAGELHRRITFRARAQVSWRTAQWQGGATLAAALAASSAALAWLDSVTAGSGALLPLVVAATVNGLVGLVRFVVLRRLFTRRPTRRPRPPVAVPGGRPLAALAA